MKAISEAISTVIIAATVVMISITIFYYALYNLSETEAEIEYGYTKSVIINIASNFPLFMRGNTYVANTPSHVVGIGYRELPYDVYLNITLPIQGATVNYVIVEVDQLDPSGTSYSGPNYYVTKLHFYLVDGEIVDFYIGLNDTDGITNPAATIVSRIYCDNGTTVELFSGVGDDVTPLYDLPIRMKIKPGDSIEIHMNDNYNDNNYGDGYFPIMITDTGLRSYDDCYEGGGFYHYTWFNIYNTNKSTLHVIPYLYKPNNYGYPTYWYRILEISFKPDNTVYYDIYYHQSDSIQYEISGILNNVTSLDRIHTRIIQLDENPKSMVVSVFKGFVSQHKIIYGNVSGDRCRFVVEDPREIPCVQEYYSNGRSIVELDTLRIYKTVYLLGAGTFNQRYLVRIVYVKLNIVIKSSSPAKISVVPIGTVIHSVYENVTNMLLIFHDESENIKYTIDLDDLIPNRNPSIPVDIVVDVQQINMVIG